MAREVFYSDKDVCLAVLGTLQYYELFQYPLKLEEVHGNLGERTTLTEVATALQELERIQAIFRFNGYYSIDKNVPRLVYKRIAANQLAEDNIKHAVRAGQLIYKFPFVRFVGISGSLSKGCADKKSDYDFFIITAANRLWICRTLLHFFKKITFLTGHQHRYCMNYFIDEQATNLTDNNRYTATELLSMIPVCGHEMHLKLMNDNPWATVMFPNGYVSAFKQQPVINDAHSLLKSMGEMTLNVLRPQKMNNWLMALTDKKWRRKWSVKNYPMDDYDIAFKTTPTISKNHPANYQKKVLERLSRTQ